MSNENINAVPQLPTGQTGPALGGQTGKAEAKPTTKEESLAIRERES